MKKKSLLVLTILLVARNYTGGAAEPSRPGADPSLWSRPWRSPAHPIWFSKSGKGLGGPNSLRWRPRSTCLFSQDYADC